MTFEEIVSRLQEDLGPMDTETELVVRLILANETKIMFTTQAFPSADSFCQWLSQAVDHVMFFHVRDTRGVTHLIRTDQIVHAEVEEEN